MHLYPESKHKWKSKNILHSKQVCKYEKIKIWAKFAHIFEYVM